MSNNSKEQEIVGTITIGVSDETFNFTDAAEYIRTVKEEFPYRSTTAFTFETLTDDPAVLKTLYDFVCGEYGFDPSDDYEDEEDEPEM